MDKHQFVYGFFILFWIFLVCVFKLPTEYTIWVLFIPIVLFYINSQNIDDVYDDETEAEIFSVTFITIGVLFSITILTFLTKSDSDPRLITAILLAVIFILLAYYHLWLGEENRHIMKIIRSCFETFAVTLYIYAIVLYMSEMCDNNKTTHNN